MNSEFTPAPNVRKIIICNHGFDRNGAYPQNPTDSIPKEILSGASEFT